jgi:transcription antitermination protein NusB
MVGRRQLREKVFKTLYSYSQNPATADSLERTMFAEIDEIFKLYVYELNFLVALYDRALEQIEINKNKYLKTEQDINPNLKFTRNKVLEQLVANAERISVTGNYPKTQWSIHDELVMKTYQRIMASKLYQDYMAEESYDFANDQKLVGKIFMRYVAENDDFLDRVEGHDLHWGDDFHIANSLVQTTIGSLMAEENKHTLLKTIKNQDDRNFAMVLLRNALSQWDNVEDKIRIRLDNWEMERVAITDKVLLMAAITELDTFKGTASSIIINEYIEISKVYSTEKSKTFINGILDKYIKDTQRVI